MLHFRQPQRLGLFGLLLGLSLLQVSLLAQARESGGELVMRGFEQAAQGRIAPQSLAVARAPFPVELPTVELRTAELPPLLAKRGDDGDDDGDDGDDGDGGGDGGDGGGDDGDDGDGGGDGGGDSDDGDDGDGGGDGGDGGGGGEGGGGDDGGDGGGGGGEGGGGGDDGGDGGGGDGGGGGGGDDDGPPPPEPPPRRANLTLTVTLTWTGAPGPVTAGEPLTYTLMIGNNGPGSATGVTLTDDLRAAGVTREAVTTTQGSCGGTDPLVCNLGRIPSGAQAIVNFTITPTVPGRITNQASVGANETDPNARNNSNSTATRVVDVISTQLGLENPRPAGCEFVNGQITCPEMASPSSISFDVDIPAGASFIEFDYAFSDADEADYGAVFLDVPAAVSERTGLSVLQGSTVRNNGPSASASPIAVLSPSSLPPEGGFQSSGLIPLSNSQARRRATMTMSNYPTGQPGSIFLLQRFRTASACPERCFGKRVTICGTRGRDRLTGRAGKDVIVGLQGNDTIKGLAGNDLICGGSGKDMLVGGPGRDRLDGGRGEDTCKGGGRADTAPRCEKIR